MIVETIFYITGSAFFVLVVVINFVVAFYLFKILQVFLKISEEINGTAREIKGKVSNFYLGFAGLTALLEKVISAGFWRGEKGANEKKEEKKESDDGEKTDEEDEDGQEISIAKKMSSELKKGKKIKKIKVTEITEE
jgi:hypothetical protein